MSVKAPFGSIDEVAQKFFKLALPCSREALKAAFRAEAIRLHPDASQADTGPEFVEMKEAYDFLNEQNGLVFWQEREAQTTDGIPLSQLGRGLKTTRNTDDCPHCKHRGYTEQVNVRYGR